jgi:hypothetical protein
MSQSLFPRGRSVSSCSFFLLVPLAPCPSPTTHTPILQEQEGKGYHTCMSPMFMTTFPRSWTLDPASFVLDPYPGIDTPTPPSTFVCSHKRACVPGYLGTWVMCVLVRVCLEHPDPPLTHAHHHKLSTVKPPWQSWLPGLAECLTLKQPRRLLASLRWRSLDPHLITALSYSIIWLTLGHRYISTRPHRLCNITNTRRLVGLD